MFIPKGVRLIQAYCVKYHTRKEKQDAKAVTRHNSKAATQSVCPTYGTKMFRIEKSYAFSLGFY